MYKLIKVSAPGFEKDFESIGELYEVFEGYVCTPCLWTRGEMIEYFKKNPDEVDPQTVEYEIREALPNDFRSKPTLERLQILLATPCGLEFEVEGIPWGW